MKRSILIEMLAERIAGVSRPHPVRVAIDGVDGVGKTKLADELVNAVSAHGRPVIRASIDGFHNPRRVRYRLGRSSPEGYFRDSFDYTALATVLLAPLGPGGTRLYRRAIFDYRIDSELATPFETAGRDAILLFDGVFLHRPELRSYWDLSVFLDAPFDVTIPRAAGRDGSSPHVDAPENRRYVEGQQLYLRTCEPKRAATIVVDNQDLASPEVVIEMKDHELVTPTDAGQCRAYHDIRRRVLFEARGQLGVYREDNPDEQAPGHHPKLLLCGGDPIGVVRIDIDLTTAILRRVAIRADVQRRGHGRVLLALAQQFARGKGCLRLASHVAPDAVEFYERCGFTVEGDRVAGSSRSESVFMTKSLSSWSTLSPFMTRQELAAAIYSLSHITGAFRLRSGAESSEYFDKYRFESDPRLLQAICTALLPFIPSTTEVLAGLELGGVPIATMLANLSGLPVVFVRKAAKNYGTCQLAEGAPVIGRTLLLVEDVVTSGGQVALSARDLRALGATVEQAVCVIDRESGGREKLADVGIELRALFGFAELRGSSVLHRGGAV